MRKSVQDISCAEDISHEAWLSVIDKAETFKADKHIKKPFKQWLYRIAHNKLIDHWRRQKNVAEMDEQAQASIVDEQSLSLEQQYLWVEIERYIAGLPPVQRQSYLLQFEGFSLTEIAKITDSQIETVKSRLRYSKKKLQELIGGDA